jgi:hypothetical protein
LHPSPAFGKASFLEAIHPRSLIPRPSHSESERVGFDSDRTLAAVKKLGL